MTEVPIIPASKSMDWFLYDRDLSHERVKAGILHQMIVQWIPLVILPDSFCVYIYFEESHYLSYQGYTYQR